MKSGGDVEVILGKAPPPGKMSGAKARPSEPGEGTDAEEGDDYSASLDSMTAFIDAVKSGDAKAALDAWKDVKANC